MGTGCRPAAVLARPENTYPAAEPGKPTQPCCWAGRATLLLSRGRRNRPSRLPPLAGRSPRSLSRAPGSVRPRGQGAAIVRRSCRPIAAFALAGTRVAPGEPGPAGSPPATVAEAALPRGRGAGSGAMTLSRDYLSSESGQCTDGAPSAEADADRLGSRTPGYGPRPFQRYRRQRRRDSDAPAVRVALLRARSFQLL